MQPGWSTHSLSGRVQAGHVPTPRRALSARPHPLLPRGRQGQGPRPLHSGTPAVAGGAAGGPGMSTPDLPPSRALTPSLPREAQRPRPRLGSAGSSAASRRSGSVVGKLVRSPCPSLAALSQVAAPWPIWGSPGLRNDGEPGTGKAALMTEDGTVSLHLLQSLHFGVRVGAGKRSLSLHLASTHVDGLLWCSVGVTGSLGSMDLRVGSPPT